MKLLNEIIELGTSTDGSIATMLRKLLVLAYDLKNQKLTEWVSGELNGYPTGSPVPDYRNVRTGARGNFQGPFGSSYANVPLPAMILKPHHRDFAERVYLRQPISGLEQSSKYGKSSMMPWPADLVVVYQSDFIEGYALHSAWLDLPEQIFVAVVDTVKTRALHFALELRSELGDVTDDLKSIPAAKVEQSVINNIWGGTNIITGSAQNFTQIGTVNVAAGDIASLAAALKNLGIAEPDIAELHAALAEDEQEHTAPGLGKRAAQWLRKVGTGVGNAALHVGADVAVVEARRALKGFLGLI